MKHGVVTSCRTSIFKILLLFPTIQRNLVSTFTCRSLPRNLKKQKYILTIAEIKYVIDFNICFCSIDDDLLIISHAQNAHKFTNTIIPGSNSKNKVIAPIGMNCNKLITSW